MKRTLGLDLGVASIGWALIENEKNQSGKIIANGVRIFDQNLKRDQESQKGESKNKLRGIQRRTRRLRGRRRRRKKALYYVLSDLNMVPNKDNKKEWNIWIQINPYEMRTKGIYEKLTLEQFGRAIYHLDQRRGYKSNRKSGNEKEGVVKKEISEVRKAMKKTESKTLGEFLFKIQDNHLKDEYKFGEEFWRRIRNKYTEREMYQEEFDLMWKKQSNYYPEILTAQLKEVLEEDVIFHQRPVGSQAENIGSCSLENDKKRIPKARLFFQEFRLIKTLNNLTVSDENGQPLLLSDEQNELIYNHLNKKETASFKSLKSLIGYNKNAVFNLEIGEKEDLIGNTTNSNLANKKAFGDDWYNLSEDLKNHIVDVLIYVEDPKKVEKFALDKPQNDTIAERKKWGRTKEQAKYLSKLSLESGYGRLSQKAISKLLPLLKDGLRENEAIKKIYGDSEDNKDKPLVTKLPMPPKIKNPVVYHALIELRKVVNAIVREYGFPDTIRVELARDLKNSKKRREFISSKQSKYEKENKEAIKALSKAPHHIQEPSRNDIIRYKLWKECKEICPYTGKPIPSQALFSGEIEVEHILPFSRTLDDSFVNKTLCYSSFNAKKSNRTPWECVEAGILNEDDLLQRIRRLPWKKKRKFTQKEIKLDEFISRQLNDTRYISREARKYLSQLGSQEWPVKVQVAKGQSTALLRHLWSLNNILSQDGDEIKNRNDHRHHAVDAVVVALTTPSILKQLSDENKRIDSPDWMNESEGAKRQNEKLKKKAKDRITFSYPWPSFRKDAIDAINSIIVSHRVSRKVSGALHLDTFYGPTEESNSKKDHVKYLAKRKAVHDLSTREVGWDNKTKTFKKNENIFIRDNRVRELVQQKVFEKYKETGDINKAITSLENDPPQLPFNDGVRYNPIRKVRLLEEMDLKIMHDFNDNDSPAPTRFAYEYHKHHIAVYQKEVKKGTLQKDEEVVPIVEAARRIKDNEPIVMKNHPEFDKFLFSLCKNETVQNLKDEEFYRVQKIAADKRVTFRKIHIAPADSKLGKIRKRPKNLEIRKVKIDPIGRIFPAND